MRRILVCSITLPTAHHVVESILDPCYVCRFVFNFMRKTRVDNNLLYTSLSRHFSVTRGTRLSESISFFFFFIDAAAFRFAKLRIKAKRRIRRKQCFWIYFFFNTVSIPVVSRVWKSSINMFAPIRPSSTL